MALRGFEGSASDYLQITSPGTVPYLYYWGFALSEAQFFLTDGPFNQSAMLVNTSDELQQTASALGVTLDPMRGVVVAVVADSNGGVAPNVRVTSNSTDSLIREFYGGSTTAAATDSSGLAEFLNVPVGTIDLTATPVVTGKASSRVTVQVRAETETVVTMRPTP